MADNRGIRNAMGLFNRSFRRNVLLTIITQAFIAVSFVILLGVLSRYFTKADMGLYGNYKSLLQFLFFLYTFGMDIGLARFLGYAEGKPDLQNEYFSTVIVLFLVILVLSTVLLYVLSGFISTRFLDHQMLLFHFTVMALIFLGLFKLVYTFYQGHRSMVAANMLQLIALGGGNVVVAVLVAGGMISNMKGVILLLSCAMAVSIPPLVVITKRHFVPRFHFRKIIRYSFPRAPHIFLSGIILTFGIMLATLFYNYETAGDFTVTTRLFRILGMGAYGFNMVLLPGVAAMVGTGRNRELGHSLSRYGDFVVWLGLLGFCGCYVLSPVVIELWLTDAYVSSIEILRIFSFSIPFYLYYLMFRSTIHGMDERPVQLYIDIAAFSFLLATFWILSGTSLSPVQTISISMAVAFCVTGVLTMWYLSRHAQVETYPGRWLIHLLIIGSCVAVSHVHPVLSAGMLVVCEGIYLFRFYPNWFGAIRNR